MDCHDWENTCKLIKKYCAEVQDLAGDAAEIGVYRGDSAVEICGSLSGCDIWLFDTFCGMPKCMISLIDYFGQLSFDKTSLGDVRQRLHWFPRVKLVPGVFPASAGAIVVSRLKFVHVDCDLYKSTWAALEWAWNRLVNGGIVLCDDYGAGSCPGARAAIDEFSGEYAIQYEVVLNRAVFRRRHES